MLCITNSNVLCFIRSTPKRPNSNTQSSNETVTPVPIAPAPDPLPGMQFSYLPGPFMGAVPIQQPLISFAPQYGPFMNMQTQGVTIPQMAPQTMLVPYQEQQRRPIELFEFAFQYIKKVKTRFPNQPRTYEQFQRIFVSYRDGK